MAYSDTEQTAARLHYSPRTLERWRVNGYGPPFLKLGKGKGGKVVYDDTKVDEWAAMQQRKSTSDQGEVA